MNCCDLAIGLAGRSPPTAASPSYGLLWADPVHVDGGFEGSRWDEDVSHKYSKSTWCAAFSVVEAVSLPAKAARSLHEYRPLVSHIQVTRIC